MEESKREISDGLAEDTIAFLKVVAKDKKSPEIIKDTASKILNSWEEEYKGSKNRHRAG